MVTRVGPWQAMHLLTSTQASVSASLASLTDSLPACGKTSLMPLYRWQKCMLIFLLKEKIEDDAHANFALVHYQSSYTRLVWYSCVTTEHRLFVKMLVCVYS
jgi:hypothetical protein